MENNRILRNICNVPDNFGHDIDIETLRQNHAGSLEDYKALYKQLERENEELKEQREEMSYKLRKIVILYSNKPGERYKGQSEDDLVKQDDYALNLRDGIDKIPLTDASKKLKMENVELKAKLEAYLN